MLLSIRGFLYRCPNPQSKTATAALRHHLASLVYSLSESPTGEQLGVPEDH